MPLGITNPDMLVVLDRHPSSAACVAIARRYAQAPLTLTAWDADATELGELQQASNAADPTVSEAIRVASQNKIPWITMRRDIAPPEQLLGDLLVAAANHRDPDLPGFAVLLADGVPPPFQRILAIVDRRGGPISGLLAYVGVAVTHRAGAALDILVIGADNEDLTAEAGAAELIAINRELELYERARTLAREAGMEPTFITASAAEDPWDVINSLLASGRYDLVIDDLGAISLSRGRVKRSVEGALSAGEVGEVPLRLLSEVPTPLLLVIDEIRLGMVPPQLLKAGAAAALTLGMASSGVLPAAAPAAAAQVRRQEDPAPLLDHLKEGIGSAASTERADEAGVVSRGLSVATQGTARTGTSARVANANQDAKKISTPKGGADPDDVAKARRAAEKSKAELAAAKKAQAKAAKALSQAEEDLVEAEAAAETSLAAIQTAQVDQEAAQATAERAVSESTGVLSVLPGGATDLDAAVALADADRAQEEYLAAVAAGGDALTELTAAQITLDDQQFRLEQAAEAKREAKAGYTADQAKFEVYRQSLASTRQAPIAKGHYRLTARFGQAGGHWSSGIHTGLDFAGKTGTTVTAAASTVVSAGYEGAYGNRVVVDHGGGYQTTYNHMSAISISPGDELSTGDQIGKLGGTGNVTGPHLHFEVTHNDKFVDPEAWLGW